MGIHVALLWNGYVGGQMMFFMEIALMRARVQERLVCLDQGVYGRSRLLRRGAHRPQS